MNCHDCDEDGVITLATDRRWGRALCVDCAQHEDEATREDGLSAFYGGSGPQTDRERMASAYALDRSQK